MILNLSSYITLNRSLENVGRSINVLCAVEDAMPYIPQIRLEQSPFEVTENMARTTAAITAHDLLQYRNHGYSIRLEEDIVTWLDELLVIDRMEVAVDEIQRFSTFGVTGGV